MFSIDKKGYNTAEVDAYLKKLSADYTGVLDALRGRADELEKTLADRESRLKSYKEKTGLITKAIMSAVEKADEVGRVAKFKYDQEMARLVSFHEKWISYYNKILEKYPLDEELVGVGQFNRQMRKILASAGDVIEELDKKFDDGLEEAYEREKKRIEDQRIGYITVKTLGADAAGSDDEIFREMIPGVPAGYDPVGRIKQYLSADKKEKEPKKSKKPSSETAAAVAPAGPALPVKEAPDRYSDRSSSGFSFEEALNPKDDIEKIMRDLGLLLEES